MAAQDTTLILQDTICRAITEWFDSGEVQFESFPSAFHSALISQTQIGWQHLFMGHWSTEWEELHVAMSNSTTKPHLWTAAMVETGLLLMIQLWEQRNQDVHGKNKIEQEQKLLQ